MDLRLGQLVYTSFPQTGFRVIASAIVPTAIQQAFYQSVVASHQDTSDQIKSGCRAVYLHQVTGEHTLFGWVYDSGLEDPGRKGVPYFICYYLKEQLFDFHLEIIFTCLQRGPVALIRHGLTALETKILPDLCSYQPARPGIIIPLQTQKHSRHILQQGKLLSLYVPANEQEIVVGLNEQTYEQQIACLSFYQLCTIEGIETTAANVDLEAVTSDRQTTEYGAKQSMIICASW